MVGGIGCMIGFGVVLDKTKAFLTALRLIAITMTVLICFAPWVIPLGNVAVASIWVFCIGAFMFPSFPTCIAFSVRLTHPIPSDVANGLMMSSSYVFSSIWGLVGASIFNYRWWIGITCFITFSLIALLGSFFTKDPLPKSSFTRSVLDGESVLSVLQSRQSRRASKSNSVSQRS